jgi:hypothetical protein
MRRNVARNDIVLLDSVIKKLLEQNQGNYQLSEQFELFCYDQVLKDYDLAVDEIEFGWVDGGDDGGIDGFYIFIDEKLITSDLSSNDFRRNPEIEVVIATCKHASTFTQVPVNLLITSIQELFDLEKEESDLVSTYNEDLLRARELFRRIYIELADKSPKLKIRFIYASRGDTAKIAANIRTRSDYLQKMVREKYFPEAEVDFEYYGASELLSLYRKTKSFSLRLKFTESVISRANTNYIILSKLEDFYRFITDDSGRLRRYLFESNVRDYLTDSPVNRDIEQTLSSGDTKDTFDFWWLNNGVTILASNANVAGKEISLENVQIVNGLQTTETIHKHFFDEGAGEDARAVLIKIIIAQDDSVRDRIIKATNNQTKVDLASLRATEKIQKDIEDVLLTKDWYYDRKKNFYKNLGKPQDRIIPIGTLSSAVYALCLRDLQKASKPKPRFMRNDSMYRQVFNENWKIEVYLASIEIVKKIERSLKDLKLEDEDDELTKPKLAFAFAMVWVVLKLKKTNYSPDELLGVAAADVEHEELDNAWEIIKQAREDYLIKSGAKTLRRAHKKAAFLKLVFEIANQKFTEE